MVYDDDAQTILCISKPLGFILWMALFHYNNSNLDYEKATKYKSKPFFCAICISKIMDSSGYIQLLTELK